MWHKLLAMNLCVKEKFSIKSNFDIFCSLHVCVCSLFTNIKSTNSVRLKCVCVYQEKKMKRKRAFVRSKARCECVQPSRAKESGLLIFSHGCCDVVVVAAAGRWQRRPRLTLAKIASAPLRLADQENETRLPHLCVSRLEQSELVFCLFAAALWDAVNGASGRQQAARCPSSTRKPSRAFWTLWPSRWALNHPAGPPGWAGTPSRFRVPCASTAVSVGQVTNSLSDVTLFIFENSTRN